MIYLFVVDVHDIVLRLSNVISSFSRVRAIAIVPQARASKRVAAEGKPLTYESSGTVFGGRAASGERLSAAGYPRRWLFLAVDDVCGRVVQRVLSGPGAGMTGPLRSTSCSPRKGL